MKKTLVFLTLTFTALFGSWNGTGALAQDARLTQSYSNPLRINPAIMGANTDIKFILNYRSQWASIDKGYSTYSFTGMFPIFLTDGGIDIGVTAMKDRAGAFSTSDLGLAVNYIRKISPNNSLSLSLIGGYVQKAIDANMLTYSNQYVMGAYNANNPSNELTMSEKTSYSDIGFGFMWFMNPKSKLNAYAGLSGYHLNQPNQSVYIGSNDKLPMRFNYQAGIKILGDNKLDFSPNVRVNTQNGNVERALGFYADYNINDNAKIVIGAWYRSHDAIAFLIGFEHNNFTLGYSYDMINTNFNKVVSSVYANEISLSLKMSRLGKANSFGGDTKGNSPKPSVRSSPFSSF